MALRRDITRTTHGPYTRLLFDWRTSGVSGGVTFVATAEITGQLLSFHTLPGSDAPDDNYDITIVDSDGLDVLMGSGADRDTANDEVVIDNLGCVVGSTLTTTVANAGVNDEGSFVVLVA
ncbi:hypothetical protein LCGC14_3086630 [marine sediment metagenome]|uniref:Uncharacterized protein n=1 Tax=marine sediment metagenome TaxID=412755 RepID=A0A0F8X0B8_9ZZZZ